MILSIKELSKAYGKNQALSCFSADFQPGIYALLGPNGAGKSTLMNIITDNLKADSGEITFGDDGKEPENIKKMGTEFRKKLGFMPQYHRIPVQRNYSFSDERILLWRFMRGGCNIASDASSLVSSDLAHMQL